MTPFLLLFVALATASPVKRQTTALDADGDGHITIIEVDNAMDLGEVLVALDTDGDQQFTVDQALQFIDHHYFNVLDTNHDHVISFQEIQDGLTLADLFAFYDRNDDGFLYGAEADRIIAMYDAAYGTAAVPAARRQRRQADGLDTNNDAHLTLSECEAGLNLAVVAYALDTDGDDGFLYGAEADRVYFMYNEVQNAAAGN
uniref:EF-hand domain-containing protein n=1 Tax=Branchiostoma floridae TaxID=7739 RepID=C3ZDT5_BRAFL|eukprot:XP_002592880.1 hypothetical protein BRAFLDRAFT_117743 [Branchiostoma floridae]